jgi:protein-disulfide isomerase
MISTIKPVFHAEKDYYRGLPNAPLVIIQYGDFLCKHCGDAFTTWQMLFCAFGDNICYVYRHYPLQMFHPLSLDAAMASEAAALQGRFWEMHDMIFKHQPFLVKSSFSRFAEHLKLDLSRFNNIRDHKPLVHKVLCDFDSGVKSGVDGTPTCFINGKRYIGFDDFESLYKTCLYALNVKEMAVQCG